MNTANTNDGAATFVEVEPNIFAPLATMKAPEEARIARRAQGFLAMVSSFVITTREDYALAAEELGNVKATWKRFETERTGFTGPLNKVLDLLNAKFQPHLKTLVAAEALWKQKMVAFDNEQERIAAVRLREAERVAQIERDRLAAEAAERGRVAQAELDRLAAIEFERAQAAAAEQVRIDEQVRAAQAAGNAQAAANAHAQALQVAERNANAAAEAAAQTEQIVHSAAVEINAIQQQQAIVIAAPMPAPSRVTGIATARSWDFEVVDFAAFARDIVLNHPEFLSLICPDQIKVRATVKSLGKNLILDGLRISDKKTIRSSAAAA